MDNGPNNAPVIRSGKVSDFTDLETWKVARSFRKVLCQLTQSFPREEKCGLSAQIRRAASSVTANFAEGYGRFSFQENLQFCRQSRGSVYELRDHLTTALDAGYIAADTYKNLDGMAVSVIKLLNGYIRSTKNLKASAGSVKL